jgi:hypothetical protein
MTEMATQPLYKAPEVPSKWDIIPIHNSDRGSFKRCRRYWDWNSPARTNLTLRADVHGVNFPLWFGTGIHYALEQYYQPGLNRDPVESWKTWFDIQWRGGIVTEDWLDKVYDLRPQRVPDNSIDIREIVMGSSTTLDSTVWRVRGLEDIIPSPNHEEFDEHYILGIEMMKFYREYAAKHDDFVVLLAEHDFSVPIWDYANDRILKAIDSREDSPNYGKELEVHSRGRQDGIIHRNGAVKLGIIDHKTAGRWGEEELFKLETDEQCTTYLAVAQIEANYYDLPHKGQPFEEIIYNVMRKAYPKPPTELKSGMFSVDRQNESTTYEMLMAWIKKNLPGIPLTEKQEEYVKYLRDVGDEQFIVREPVRRNQAQLQNAMERMFLEALDMLDPNVRIYPNLTNDWLCRNCQFRAPCVAKESGADWKQLIQDNYASTKDR